MVLLVGWKNKKVVAIASYQRNKFERKKKPGKEERGV